MRIINADELKEKIRELIPRWNDQTEYGKGRIRSYEFVLKAIDNSPTVEVKYLEMKDNGEEYIHGYEQGYKDAMKTAHDAISDFNKTISMYANNSGNIINDGKIINNDKE